MLAVARTCAIFLATLHLVIPVSAWAGPQGAQVTHGSATFERTGNSTVIRAADNTVIRYGSFDIGRNESVRFIQPGPAARVLNRIQSPRPTHIDGTLRANGQV